MAEAGGRCLQRCSRAEGEGLQVLAVDDQVDQVDQNGVLWRVAYNVLAQHGDGMCALILKDECSACLSEDD